MSDNEKFVISVKPEVIRKVDAIYKDSGYQNRSRFIEDAIEYYIGYVTANDCRDYFPEVITKTVDNAMTPSFNRMASLLFKLAVEISMMLHVTCATNEIDKEELNRLRGMCVNEVKRLNGKISFDKAFEKQKGEYGEE